AARKADPVHGVMPDRDDHAPRDDRAGDGPVSRAEGPRQAVRGRGTVAQRSRMPGPPLGLGPRLDGRALGERGWGPEAQENERGARGAAEAVGRVARQAGHPPVERSAHSRRGRWPPTRRGLAAPDRTLTAPGPGGRCPPRSAPTAARAGRRTHRPAARRSAGGGATPPGDPGPRARAGLPLPPRRPCAPGARRPTSTRRRALRRGPRSRTGSLRPVRRTRRRRGPEPPPPTRSRSRCRSLDAPTRRGRWAGRTRGGSGPRPAIATRPRPGPSGRGGARSRTRAAGRAIGVPTSGLLHGRRAGGYPGLLPRAVTRLTPVDYSASTSCRRSWLTALVWIWHTRDSVTPRISPISARVRPSK